MHCLTLECICPLFRGFLGKKNLKKKFKNL